MEDSAYADVSMGQCDAEPELLWGVSPPKIPCRSDLGESPSATHSTPPGMDEWVLVPSPEDDAMSFGDNLMDEAPMMDHSGTSIETSLANTHHEVHMEDERRDQEGRANPYT